MENITEIWKTVAVSDGSLEVSSLGRLRRLDRLLVYADGRSGTRRGGILLASVGKNGYKTTSVGRKKYAVHRLVAETFLEKPDEFLAYATINHVNGNKLDNRVVNLEWATYTENNRHAREISLNMQHAERCNLTKYTDQFITAVRNVHAIYHPNWEELGRIFGLTGCHARQIVLRLTRAKDTTD